MSGALVGFAKVTRDLTERKRNQDEQQARFAAEHANRINDQFLALLGHELRNPLAPILTAVQLIKLRGNVPSPREIAVIERQLQLMTHLVDDLLDVSRVTRGTLALNKQPIDVRDAIARAIEIASPMIDQKRHRLLAAVAPDPLPIDGDLSRLTQAFTNLLTNAAKYTEPGGQIRIAVRKVDDQVVAEVRDTGIGIATDLIPRVFDLFVQGASSNERMGGGLGLGLTLVRSVVQLHGGIVSVKSDGPGTGSTFTVRLASTSQAVAKTPADEHEKVCHRQVLAGRSCSSTTMTIRG